MNILHFAMISSMLCMHSLYSTMHYDDNGHPDYDKINESLEQERKDYDSAERERRDIRFICQDSSIGRADPLIGICM